MKQDPNSREFRVSLQYLCRIFTVSFRVVLVHVTENSLSSTFHLAPYLSTVIKSPLLL